jgi:hypothetical protein
MCSDAKDQAMSASIQGLWIVLVDGILGEGGGVVTVVDGRLFGGDSGHIYLGAIATEANSISGTIEIQAFIAGFPNVLGAVEQVEVFFSGKLEAGRIDGMLCDSQGGNNALGSVRLTKKADLTIAPDQRIGSRKPSLVLVRSGDRKKSADSKFGGLWTIHVGYGQSSRSGVLLLTNEVALGGDSGFTFVGTTKLKGAELLTARLSVHNFSPTFPNIFGFFGNCEVDLVGALQGDEMLGSAAVVHRPDITGSVRLVRRARLSHPLDRSATSE